MGDLAEAAGAIGGLLLGGALLLLLAPTLESVKAVNLEAWGTILFVLGALFAIVTAAAAVKNLLG